VNPYTKILLTFVCVGLAVNMAGVCALAVGEIVWIPSRKSLSDARQRRNLGGSVGASSWTFRRGGVHRPLPVDGSRVRGDWLCALRPHPAVVFIGDVACFNGGLMGSNDLSRSIFQ
jgi:hypothetical protein